MGAEQLLGMGDMLYMAGGSKITRCHGPFVSDEEVEEIVFCINKDMTKDEKLKILRKEYSRWNALTNNTDKMIRERAKEMRDLAANLRSQYNK